MISDNVVVDKQQDDVAFFANGMPLFFHSLRHVDSTTIAIAPSY